MKTSQKASPLLAINPEFQRNVWLELSPGRVLGMALAVVLLTLGIYKLFGQDLVSSMLNNITFVLLILWGPLLAADSVLEEAAGRTWDVQRLSAQRASGLVLGKLLGGTIYAWFGAALCAIGMAVFAHDHIHNFYDRALEGGMAQSAAMLAALAMLRFRNAATGRVARLGAWLIGIFLAAFFSVLVSKLRGDDFDPNTASWYGLHFTGARFIYLSEMMMIVWMVIGMIRLTRRELGYRDGPTGWALFVVYMMVYAAGLQTPQLILTDITKTKQSHALLAAQGLTYVALLGLPVAVAVSRKWVMAWKKKDRATVWAETPSWVPAFALTLIAGVIVAANGAAPALGALAVIGFLLRDIIVVYGLRTHFTRRAEVAIVLYFAFVYLVSNFVIDVGYNLASGDTHGFLHQAFFPYAGTTSIGALFPFIEAAIGWLIFRKSFTKLYRPVGD